VGQGRIVGGTYVPRPRRAQLADAIEDARHAFLRLVKIMVLRGAGAVVLLGSLCAILALASYSPRDGSLNNATARDPANLLGGVGATAADLLLQTFGLAALCALAPPAVWGARAFLGKGLTHAIWRAIAWPLGTVFVAAGLGVFPAPFTMPAGAGGLTGIAVYGLSHHAALAYGESWVGIALPLSLLLAGLPLAFLATGLKFRPLARGATYIPAVFIWLARSLHLPEWLTRTHQTQDDDVEHDLDREHDEDDEEDHDAYHLDTVPEPVSARSTNAASDLRASRVKREDLRKHAPVKPKAANQPALHLAEGEYELPPLGLLA